MLLAVFDFETNADTGENALDVTKALPYEVGVILYTTSFKRIVMMENFLVDHELKIAPEATELTRVNTKMVEKFGRLPGDGLSILQNYFDMADVIAGKNIVNYDYPIYQQWCKRAGEEVIVKPIIDIETDIPGVESKKLAYMAADAGFLNPFSHGALADAWTSLRLIEHYGFEQILERSKSPRAYVKAHVSFDTNYLAKEQHFKWEPVSKVWFKMIKEEDIDKLVKACSFDISRISDPRAYGK